jgi:peptidoglycan/LPS O-acetylase OafA/YrhL
MADLKYRPDIDGLRAVAIIPVVAFHAGLPGIEGGYVGVDIFFVISGFLIAGLLQREIADGRFSIIGFYERRIRRILPALIAVLLATLLAAGLIFLPDDFRKLPEAALAALGFVSNLLLAGQVDYFAAPDDTQPLLHTWSLSVEEQYYLVFPILLFALNRYFPRRVPWFLAVIMLWSFTYNILAVESRPATAYFLTQVRIWELLVGALLALGAVPAIDGRWRRELLAGGGMTMIAIAIFTFSARTPFPGFAGLLPVIGAALVIHCAPHGVVGALLSRPAAVFVGLISYSLYLWHWPIIVFSSYLLERPIAGVTSLPILALIGIVGIASWRFVERPFRHGNSRGRIFIYAGGAVLAMLAICLAAWKTDGWPRRFSAETLRLEDYANSVAPARSRCHLGDRDDVAIRDQCVFGASAANPSVAVWGDSHGVELAWMLGKRLAGRGIAVQQFTFSSCAPALDRADGESVGCGMFNRLVSRTLLADPQMTTVVLIAHLDRPEYRTNTRYLSSYAMVVEALLKRGKHVVLVYPVPRQAAPVPRMLARRNAYGMDLASAGIVTADYVARMSVVTAFLDRLQDPHLIHIRTPELLCKNAHCRPIIGSEPLYYDSHHLSLPGADLVGSAIETRLFAEPATDRRRLP